MNARWPADDEIQKALSARLLDVLIRAGFIAVLAALCYIVFAPFLTLMVWAVILAVTLYPLHQRLARRNGGQRRVVKPGPRDRRRGGGAGAGCCIFSQSGRAQARGKSDQNRQNARVLQNAHHWYDTAPPKPGPA